MQRFILHHITQIVLLFSLLVFLLSAALFTISALVREDGGKQLQQLINTQLSGINVAYDNAVLHFSLHGAHFGAANVSISTGNQHIVADYADIWWSPGQRLRIHLQKANFQLQPLDEIENLSAGIVINLPVELSAPHARLAIATFPLTLTNTDIFLNANISSWTANLHEKQPAYQLDVRASGRLDDNRIQLYAAGENLPPTLLPLPFDWSAAQLTLAARIDNDIAYRAGGTFHQLGGNDLPLTLHAARWRTSGRCQTTDCLNNIHGTFTASASAALPYNPAVTVNLSSADGSYRHSSDWNVSVPRLQLNSNDAALQAHIAVDANLTLTLITASGSSTRPMALTAVAHYVSYDDELHTWFNDSILGGDIVQATFAFQADNPLQLAQSTIQVTADFRNGTLVIADEWPLADDLTGTFHLHNDDIVISGSGTYDTLSAAQVTVSMPATAAEKATLYLTVRADRAALTSYVHAARRTPAVADAIRATDSEFQITGGRGELSLAVTVPLADVDASRAKAYLSVQHGAIQVPELPDYLGIQGDIHINNERAYGKLSGSLAGTQLPTKPINVTFDNRDVQIAGNVAIPLLLSLAGFADAPASGSTPFLYTRNPRATVFSAPLTDTTIDLPYPLGKPATLRTPLTVTLAATTAIRYHNPQLTLHVMTDGQGTDIALNTAPADPPARGFNLRGGGADINLDAWLQQSGGDAVYFSTLQLTLAQTTLFQTVSERMVINGSGSSSSTLSLQIDADSIGGALRMNNDTVHAQLAYLKLTLTDDSNDAPPDAASNTAPDIASDGIGTPDITSLTLTLGIDRLEVNALTLGQVALAAAPRQERWQITLLQISNSQATVDMQGDFYNGQTSLSVHLQAEQLPELISVFAIPPIFSSGSVSLFGSIQWDGAPTDINLDKLSGDLRLLGNDVRYTDIEFSTNVVNFLSVFSPQSILSLGFTDLAGGGGIVFQTVEGTVSLDGGTIALKPLNMESRNMGMSIEGTTNYITHQHDLFGEVRPGAQLLGASSTIGLGAGLVALNPASLVAGVFLGKLFEKPISEIGGYRYTITGDWSDPVYTEMALPDSPATETETETKAEKTQQ